MKINYVEELQKLQIKVGLYIKTRQQFCKESFELSKIYVRRTTDLEVWEFDEF